jgi:hypothetical protein
MHTPWGKFKQLTFEHSNIVFGVLPVSYLPNFNNAEICIPVDSIPVCVYTSSYCAVHVPLQFHSNYHHVLVARSSEFFKVRSCEPLRATSGGHLLAQRIPSQRRYPCLRLHPSGPKPYAVRRNVVGQTTPLGIKAVTTKKNTFHSSAHTLDIAICHSRTWNRGSL